MASRRAERRRACGSKIRYASKADAAAFVRLKGWRGLHAYHCPFCGGVHLGHRPRAGRTRRAGQQRRAGFR